MTTIEFYRKVNYGVEAYYIKDQRQADIVRGLTGKITVSIQDLKLLNVLTGFEVVEVLAPGEVIVEKIDDNSTAHYLG